MTKQSANDQSDVRMKEKFSILCQKEQNDSSQEESHCNEHTSSRRTTLSSYL